jgi:hypothetical protein
MTLQLTTDRTPVRNKANNPSTTEFKYSFRIIIGGTVFSTAWFFGDDERLDGHTTQVQEAFKDADRIEVIR